MLKGFARIFLLLPPRELKDASALLPKALQTKVFARRYRAERAEPFLLINRTSESVRLSLNLPEKLRRLRIVRLGTAQVLKKSELNLPPREVECIECQW